MDTRNWGGVAYRPETGLTPSMRGPVIPRLSRAGSWEAPWTCETLKACPLLSSTPLTRRSYRCSATGVSLRSEAEQTSGLCSSVLFDGGVFHHRVVDDLRDLDRCGRRRSVELTCSSGRRRV